MSRQRPERVAVPAPALLRRFSLALTCAIVVLALTVTAILRQDVLHQRVLLERESEHVLALQQEFLRRELGSVHSDLLYLSTQDALQRFLAGDETARGQLEATWVDFALHKRVYDQVRCLDARGQEVARVNYRQGEARVVPSGELQSKARRYYFQQAWPLGKGEVLVSPFDLNVEHGRIERPIKPVVRFLTPVCDDADRKRGVLVLNYLGAHLLAKLKQISSGFRGETMLVNANGDHLQSSDPGQDWAWLLGREGSFRSTHPAAWEHARGPGGRVEVGDSSFTFRRISPRSLVSRPQPADIVAPAGDDGLILVAHVPSSVANEHSRHLLRQLSWICIGVIIVVALLSYYWARSGLIRRQHEQRIAQSEIRLRQLSSRLLATQEAERRSLSRDLHDELGQQVTAIGLDLRSIAKKDAGAEASPALQRAVQRTDHLLESLHEIAARVRPSTLDDLGLHVALESLLAEYEERTDIHVRARLRFEPGIVSGTIGENVFRIVQEALANVAAHAGVDEVEVEIEIDDGVLHLRIEDRGSGFDPSERREPRQLGILGMRERVELLGGEFDLRSAPGEGTRLSASIPLCGDGR